MSPEETQDFLQDLTDRITQPQFCYAYEYEKGELLVIDDRASLHKAGFDYEITANLAGCTDCLCVATVPTNRSAPGRKKNQAEVRSNR
jgi:hypothetical protein